MSIPAEQSATTETSGSTEIRSVSGHFFGGRARRPAQAYKRDQMARTGNGLGRFAGPAAGDDAGTRPATGGNPTTRPKCEAKLNALPQFVTEIDGLEIQFIHVRSKNANAFPVDHHAWMARFDHRAVEIIEPLTDPTAHGGSAGDAFHR